MARAAKRLFICLDNAGYEVSLERLKIYVALPDAKAEGTGTSGLSTNPGRTTCTPANISSRQNSQSDPACGPTSRVIKAIDNMPCG